MRKEGYYWAKHKHMTGSEVVFITSALTTQAVWRNSFEDRFWFSESDFDWIDDEPIPEKKMPVELVHDAYYVIRNDMKPFVGKWDEGMKCFHGGCQHHWKTSVTVISGPFHIDQLISLKPS